MSNKTNESTTNANNAGATTVTPEELQAAKEVQMIHSDLARQQSLRAKIATGTIASLAVVGGLYAIGAGIQAWRVSRSKAQATQTGSNYESAM